MILWLLWSLLLFYLQLPWLSNCQNVSFQAPMLTSCCSQMPNVSSTIIGQKIIHLHSTFEEWIKVLVKKRRVQLGLKNVWRLMKRGICKKTLPIYTSGELEFHWDISQTLCFRSLQQHIRRMHPSDDHWTEDFCWWLKHESKNQFETVSSKSDQNYPKKNPRAPLGSPFVFVS